MGKKDFICGSCKKSFATEATVRAHIWDIHRKSGETAIYQKISTHRGRDFDDTPSMAELAIEAEIDRAMGIPNDNDWLLP